MKDAARMGFEAFMAKAQEGDGPADPWTCFQAGYTFAEVEAARGTVHALAAIRGDLAGAEVAADTGPIEGSTRGHGMPLAGETSLAASAPLARSLESDLREDR